MLNGIFENLVAGIIGSLLGFLAKLGFDHFQKIRKSRSIIDFFNLKKGKVAIIHSAIFDSERGVYNYPASDTRATRMISKTLESVDLREGQDFIITPDMEFINHDGSLRPKLMDFNIVLTCAPKRNKVTEEILSAYPKVRYRLSFDPSTHKNLLYDSYTNNYFVPSRDIPNSIDNKTGYDFGLIMAASSPLNPAKHIVILAGIHGSGTIGAAMAVSNSQKLQELCSKRVGGIIQAVVRAEYQDDYDNVVDISLV